MLQTNLEHVTSEQELDRVLAENENVMIACGRMGPMCTPVYEAMQSLDRHYDSVAFRDMAFDSPVARRIRNLKETSGFMGLPFTVYFKNGKVVEATSGIQNKAQVAEILDRKLVS